MKKEKNDDKAVRNIQKMYSELISYGNIKERFALGPILLAYNLPSFYGTALNTMGFINAKPGVGVTFVRPRDLTGNEAWLIIAAVDDYKEHYLKPRKEARDKFTFEERSKTKFAFPRLTERHGHPLDEEDFIERLDEEDRKAKERYYNFLKGPPYKTVAELEEPGKAENGEQIKERYKSYCETIQMPPPVYVDSFPEEGPPVQYIPRIFKLKLFGRTFLEIQR